MRSRFDVLLVVSVASTVVAGCTLLIAFDDVPPERDAGVDRLPPPDDAVAEPNDASRDVDPPDDDAGAPDAVADVDYGDACNGRPDGRYCNGNQIVVDGGDRHDLITCSGGRATVRYCEKGIGCVRMPGGFPDECDECEGRAAGQYCGDDFAGWHPTNARARIRCENNAVSGSLICNASCIGTGPNASCQ